MPLDGSNNPAVADLIALRGIIERGWCQGRWETESGEHCLMAAINLAASGHAMDLVRPLRWLAGTDNLQAWQDAPDRTKEDVLLLIDSAIIDRR